MTADPGPTGRSILQTCEACGVDFAHDVPRCPDCGQLTAVSTRKAIIIAVALVLVLAVIAALWAAGVTPISPDA